jgi:hypothetical protein
MRSIYLLFASTKMQILTRSAPVRAGRARARRTRSPRTPPPSRPSQVHPTRLHLLSSHKRTNTDAHAPAPRGVHLLAFLAHNRPNADANARRAGGGGSKPQPSPRPPAPSSSKGGGAGGGGGGGGGGGSSKGRKEALAVGKPETPADLAAAFMAQRRAEARSLTQVLELGYRESSALMTPSVEVKQQ